ncbi:unnamed protein product [Orchesella dallaii]|uniref:Uncharacterized protein n=1 Tax=Orchesella dallaii TaxID=48710 RepID=A0ABP1QCG2_9HEXA
MKVKEFSSPSKIHPHSPKIKTKPIGHIRIVHSDSTVSISNLTEISNVKKGKGDAKLISEVVPQEKEEEEEEIESPLLCCRLFALLATCFEHAQDQVEVCKTWCGSKLLRKKENTSET